MKIIPAIDILDGKCVRLLKGKKEDVKVYFEQPLDAAEFLNNKGFKQLHVVDLDGAFSGQTSNLDQIKAIKNQFDLAIEYGGGIRSVAKAEEILSTDIDQIIIGTMAIKNAKAIEYLIKNYQERIIVSLDVNGNNVAIKGWEEDSQVTIDQALQRLIGYGLKHVLITDISKDGTLAGPNVKLYQKILNTYDVNLIASGGVGSDEDLQALEAIGVQQVVVGKAIYENKIKQ
jgi:phosphoribosylformimino-5-aminoimidazole carboxamide ribotide isomerase